MKILVILALGIMVPAIFLGYLGYRSFHYEGILLGKQMEERHAELGDVLERKADEILQRPLDSLHALLDGTAFHAGDREAIALKLVDIEHIDSLPIRHLFVVDLAGHFLFPPPVRDTPGSAIPDVDWGRFSAQIEQAQQLEFVANDDGEAASVYDSLTAAPLDSEQRAALLQMQAGLYRKQGKPLAAESRYVDLVRRFDQQVDPSGLPDGILGRQFLIRLYLNTNQTERAIAVQLDVLERLLLEHWELDPKQRAALWNSLSQDVEREMNNAPDVAADLRQRWNRLGFLRSRFALLQQESLTFQRTEWKKLQPEIHFYPDVTRGYYVRSTTGSSDESSFFIVSPIIGNTPGDLEGMCIVEVSGRSIMAPLLATLNDMALTSGFRVDIDDKEKGAVTGLANWKASLGGSIERPLAHLVPPLYFRLTPEGADIQNILHNRRERLFGGIIGLSVIVMVAGLLLIAHAIRREMEVATLRSDFVANVSHELRTPLSAIAYIGERLSLGQFRSPQETAEFYSMLAEETGRLREMIEDILDFSKMMDGRRLYKKTRCDLVAIIEEADERFKAKAASKDFRVHCQAPDHEVYVSVDRRAVLQAILNLLENALKYSRDKREIELRLGEENEWATVQVQDFGIGIPLAEQSKIFEKFYRVEHAERRDTDGVGLGLAMVKHIVEKQGGRVSVSSVEGQGSLFTLWFLRAPDPERR